MHRPKIIFAAVTATLLVAFWFLAVDWSWYVDDCPRCYLGRDVYQYRLLGRIISERVVEDPSLVQLVATDLGAECAHPTMTRWHKHRRWGLCLCANPCINGLYRLDGNLDYDEATRAKVRKMALDEPSLRDEFSRRVLDRGNPRDWDYWKKLVARIRE